MPLEVNLNTVRRLIKRAFDNNVDQELFLLSVYFARKSVVTKWFVICYTYM